MAGILNCQTALSRPGAAQQDGPAEGDEGFEMPRLPVPMLLEVLLRQALDLFPEIAAWRTWF